MKADVPFLNLPALYQSIKEEVDEAIAEVLQSSSYVLGPAVEKFEADFAAYCGAKYAVGCNSGTSALHMALMGLDVGPGDEVITVSHTFIATAWGITYCNAEPVFVDVDPVTKTMDAKLLESRITPRTKAIIPVHLYGHPADMDPIMEVARRHGLAVIEDAAQAHGARYKGRRAGSMGDAACFSFYPGKNLGAFGEGGAVLTDDDALARRLRMLRDHGQSERYHHDIVGFNYRMEGIQGAVLGMKLRHLDGWNSRRRDIASIYNEMLSGVPGLELPAAAPWAEPVYHLYVLQHPDREGLRRALAEKGVATGLHYPIPVHKQKAYGRFNSLSLPVTERAAATCLSLPMDPGMTDAMVERVVDSIRDIVKNGS